MEINKLQKSVTDSKLSGVCGGIGKFFGIDSFIVRTFFLLSCLFLGSGIFIYATLYLMIPSEIDGYKVFS
ncbi:MAG: PspC domain-containing protein [Clostridiaceae bacterium]|nr:PspC domain-containing protein [Clostridiaceae bacterium]